MAEVETELFLLEIEGFEIKEQADL